MRKIKEFMAKPITWGGYLKFLFWCTIGSMLYCVVMLGWMFGWFNKVVEKISKFFGKFSKKQEEPAEEQ